MQKKSTVTKKTQVAPFNGVGYGKDTTATSKPAKIPSSEKPKTNETTEKPKVGFYTFNALPKVVTKQIRFESFLRKYMPNFSDKQWKTQNMVQHAPSGLSKHVSDSILVFDFRDDVRGCFLLGATMFRMTNYSKCRMPYEQKARAILQIDSGTGTIVGRWTDWQPNTSTSRTRPGIYTHMVQKLGYRVSQIFQNQGAFQKAYKMGKIDSKYESEVCMFEETDSSFLKPLAKEG